METGRRRRQRLKKQSPFILTVTGIYTILAALVIVGLCFHTCPTGVFLGGRYTIAYLKFLAAVLVASAAGGIGLWRLLRHIDVRATSASALKRTVSFILAPAATALSILAAAELLNFGLYLRADRRDVKPGWRIPHMTLGFATARQANEAIGVNRFGFIGPDNLHLPRNNRARIFALGGSTTECDRSTNGWPACLGRLLTDGREDSGVDVYNAGVAGWNSQQSLIEYLFYVREFKPDIVIFYHAVNDMLASLSPRHRRYETFYSDYCHDLNGRGYWGAYRPLLATFFGYLMENMFSDFRQPEEKEWDDFPSLYTFRRNLEMVLGQIRRDGAVPILVTQPTLHSGKMDPKQRARCWIQRQFWRLPGGAVISSRAANLGLERFNDCIRDVGRQLDCHVVDFAPTVPKDLEFFLDDVHLTAQGNAELARQISEVIKPLLNGRAHP